MKYLIAICLLLAGCGSQNQPVVMIIGDSISLGYTPYVQQELDGRYIVFHSEGNPANSNNDQSSGYTLQHLDQWLNEAGPVNVIHANWGLWDIHGFASYQGSTLVVYRANIEAIASRLDKTGARIIWATITPTPINSTERTLKQVQEYNAVLLEVAHEHGYEIDDLYSYMLPYQNLHISDSNIHYTNEGYQFISYSVSNSINQK